MRSSVLTRAPRSPAARLLLAVVAALALTRTLEALRQVEGQFHSTGLEGREDLLTAYAGGALGIVAVCAAVFGAVLMVLRVTEPGRVS